MPPKKRSAAAAKADPDPTKLSVVQLKEELKKRGCPCSGAKAELVSRLQEKLKESDPPVTKKVKVSPEEEEESGASGVDFSKMKVADLRAECEKKGLDSSGKKAELVSRLEGAATTTGGGATSKKKPASSGKAKATAATSLKKEETKMEEETDYSKAKRALTTAEPAKTKKKRQPKVDSFVPGASNYKVEGDWDCMLNQTNIGQNNNKYYVIQLLTRTFITQNYYVWTRWGRVGEPGQHAMKGPFADLETAGKEFKKKFSDKTKNQWDKRHNFTPAPGKYTLLEMDDDSGDEEEIVSKLEALEDVDAPKATVKPCSLDKPTQDLVKLIFNNDMFKEAMQRMDIDTKKMPLGKLSKAQIAKGFQALEEIEDALKSKSSGAKLGELTSKFYTIIPHDFGRKVPPVIRDSETLQKKFDMLLVLGDIEIAQGIERDKEKKQKEAGGEMPHPLDLNYELLKAHLVHLDKKKEEFGFIEQYLKATESPWRKLQLLDVWKVDRHGVEERFKEHDSVENRRLLWHGTNVAVVAAILKSGLRIMPHSGGRVGRGIYFASENSKSAGYVRTAGNTGIMFLNEVVLGKEHHITRDDHTLTSAPPGFHCVIAKGRTEPDPKNDITIDLDGKTVHVPQGKPISMSEYSSSSFSQSEYLVYKESQSRIRYLLKLKF